MLVFLIFFVLIFTYFVDSRGGCNKSETNLPKFPISIDIAEHMETKQHQNFVPIKNAVRVTLQNLTFNPDHHKSVIKKWKHLVKDGDITEVEYQQPRRCPKCSAVLSDAIEMFKHIKDNHVKS